MPEGVKETLCTYCDHREVCVHKLDYLNILKAIKDVTVAKETPYGKEPYRRVADYDFISEISIGCRYYRNWTDVYRDYENDD